MNFFYYNNQNKKLNEVIFEENKEPFYQTKYFQDYIKNNI